MERDFMPGVKMPRAREAQTLAPVTLADRANRGNWQGVCYYCIARVSYVEEHRAGEDDHPVNRFFRLIKLQRHDFGCQYNVDSEVERLVAESDDVENLPKARLFQRSQDGRIEFRLHVLVNALDQAAAGDLEEQGAEPQQRARHVPNGRRLAPYVRSAVGLAKLFVALSGDFSELAERVTIVNGQNVVPWRYFCFSQGSYERLWLRGRSRVLPPVIAMEFIAKQLEDGTNGVKYRGYADVAASESRGRRVFVPRVFSSNARALAAIEMGGRYIVIGRPWEPREQDQYRNITVGIERATQIARVLEEDVR